MNFKNKLLIFYFILISIIPLDILAYSSHIIPGGDNIGIELKANGVLIVGFYKVNNKYIGLDSGFKVGDLITEVNGEEVSTIAELVNKTATNSNILITFIRGNKVNTVNLDLNQNENGVYKTGLYVKDQINGIGTLTYIDPNTKIFGALGHEVMEKTTAKKFEIKDGKIYKSVVVDVTKSIPGFPGEKSARFDQNTIYGNIFANEKSGVFGYYLDSFPKRSLMEVGKSTEIEKGEALIRTVIDKNDIQEYKINIINIDHADSIKNILFEITDKTLLEKTNGVIQGMSGSPIIQNSKIIGAVTHVIVNDSRKGYGIFITAMLEEGEN